MNSKKRPSAWSNTPAGWTGAFIAVCIGVLLVFYYNTTYAAQPITSLGKWFYAICVGSIWATSGNRLFHRGALRYRQYPQELLFICGVMMLRGLVHFAVNLHLGAPYLLMQMLVDLCAGLLVTDRYLEKPTHVRRTALVGAIGGACIGVAVAWLTPVLSYGTLSTNSLSLKLLMGSGLGLLWGIYGLILVVSIFFVSRASMHDHDQSTAADAATETPVANPALETGFITGVLSFKGIDHVIIGGIALQTDRQQLRDLKIGMTYKAEYQSNERRLIEVERIVNTPLRLTFGDTTDELN